MFQKKESSVIGIFDVLDTEIAKQYGLAQLDSNLKIIKLIAVNKLI